MNLNKGRIEFDWQRPILMKTLRTWLYLFIMVVLPVVTHAMIREEPPPLHIDSIVVVGNDVTRSEIILREIEFSPGQWIDSAEIEKAQLRITNLNLFNRVEIFPMKQTDRTILVVSVSEKLYIFPLPYASWIGPKSNDFEYGFRYSQYNLQGLNRSLAATIYGGVTRGYQLVLYDPWIIHTPGIGALLVLQHQTWWQDIPDEQGSWRRERMMGIGGISKRFTPEVTIKLLAGYQRIRVVPRFSLSGSGIDEMYIGRFEYIQDRRDLIELPHRGDFMMQSVELLRFTQPWESRYTFTIDLRQYQPLSKRWTLSGQTMAMAVTGTNPSYMELSLGESLPIRGYRNLSQLGTFMAKGGVDLRYQLYPTHYWTWDTAPTWIAKKVKNLKYGLSVSGFYEAGQSWRKTTTLESQRLMSGYGVALSVTIPYVNILRVDVGFNPEDKMKPNFKAEMRAGI